MATATLEQQEAQNRNIVPRLDGTVAIGTARAWPDGGLSRRQAVYQDVQIAADDQADESGIDKDGSPKHWLVRTSPIKDANGTIVAAIGIKRV